MKTPDYLSYDRYKKKKSSKPSKRFLIFTTTFFLTLFLFTVVAKGLSPNVDVTIGNDSETDAKETGLGVKKFIDERLKMIQMEDNNTGASTSTDNKNVYKSGDASFNDYSKKLESQNDKEEKVNIPNQKAHQTTNPSYQQNQANPFTQQAAPPPRPTNSDLSKPFNSTRTSSATKVYVGRYSNVEQAKVAQGILMDSGLNISPYVKNMGSYYTLQVGSYSNKATASSVANQLQQNNFPARVVQEQ